MRKYQHFKNVHILIHESGGEKTSIRLLLSFRKYEPQKKKKEKSMRLQVAVPIVCCSIGPDIL